MEEDLVEKIYWSHFRSVQFYQTLSARFDQELAIPQSFSKNLKEKLRGNVSLKVPSGATWNVGLVTSEDTLFFRKGWKDFIVGNSLKENDLLIFKYIGESRFEMLLFDHQSQSEKASSYFVRKHSQSQQEENCRENLTPASTEKSQRCSDNLLEEAERSSDRNVASAERSEERITESAKVAKMNGASTPTSVRQTSQTNEPIRRKRLSLKVHDRQSLTNRIDFSPTHLVSRPVTEEGKQKALQRANAVSSRKSLVVVMQSSQVSQYYFMLIPSWYSKLHHLYKNMDIFLHVEGDTWKTTFFCNKSSKVGGGRLRGGWKKFALDNHLEEFDVCLFNKSETTQDADSDLMHMDVSIFRARDEEIGSFSDSG